MTYAYQDYSQRNALYDGHGYSNTYSQPSSLWIAGPQFIWDTRAAKSKGEKF